jgi:hypothetical protein
MAPKTVDSTSKDKIELRPDGWERFERAVDIAARTPAIRRTKPPAKKPSVVKDKRKP